MSEVYSVAGHVDLIAIVRVREFDEIAEVIAGGISKVEGVVTHETHIAFRAYSRHDLEEAFAIGFTLAVGSSRRRKRKARSGAITAGRCPSAPSAGGRSSPSSSPASG